MSEAQTPNDGSDVSTEAVRALMGASTPHFALQLRNRIARLIAPLAADHPARVLGEQEIDRLTSLGYSGEVRGTPHEPAIRPLASVSDPAAEAPQPNTPVTAPERLGRG